MTRLFVLLMALSLTACEFKEVEREIGYKGKARVNPWLAAERFGKRMGRETLPVISWTPPEPRDAAWLMPAAILGNTSFTRRVESWVRGGGHLILLVEHAASDTSDWSEFPAPPMLERPLFRMLERADLLLTESGGAQAGTIDFGGRRFKVSASSKATVAVSGDKPGVFASMAEGAGRITVLTDGRLFRNRWIGENDHAALLDALIDSSGPGRVGIMRDSGLSLWALLGHHLWPILLGLGAMVLLWLWKCLPRFGPLEAEAAPQELRGYEHHLEALGDFQWRLDRASSMLGPLRDQIVELGQRASTRAGRRDADFFQFLADRAGLPRERVFRALAETAPADAAILTRTTADLQQLLKVLHHRSQP